MALDSSSAALHPLHFQRPAANLGRRWLQLRDFSEKFPAAACENWLAQQLNRPALPAEFYLAGRELYDAGMYLGASKLLKLYVETPNALLPGHHLLGYAYFMNGNKALALKHLTLCANDGFDSDWQLLTEIAFDLEQQERNEQLLLMQVRQRDEVENHHTRPAVPIAAAIAAPHLETSDADSTREVGVRTPLPSPSGSVTAVASLSASPRAVAPSSLPSISAEPLAPATTPSLLQPQPPATLPPPATFPYRRPLIAAASNSGKSPAPAPRVSVRNLISDEVSASLPFSRRLESLAATLSAPPSLSDDGKEEIVECIEPPTAEVPPKTAAPHSSRAGAESSTALEAKSAATVKGVVRFAPVEPSPRERIVHKQP